MTGFWDTVRPWSRSSAQAVGFSCTPSSHVGGDSLGNNISALWKELLEHFLVLLNPFLASYFVLWHPICHLGICEGGAEDREELELQKTGVAHKLASKLAPKELKASPEHMRRNSELWTLRFAAGKKPWFEIQGRVLWNSGPSFGDCVTEFGLPAFWNIMEVCWEVRNTVNQIIT